MVILQSGIGNYVRLNNKQYSYFAGNNYLGLANHPVLTKAAIAAIETYGVNFSASRKTTGTSELHLELERQLAEFKNKQDSVVFASGYLGNKILLHALHEHYDTVLVDESAHPSIIDGIPADVSKVLFYRHCHADHLASLLKKNENSKQLVSTDGIFALTGEIAPLDKINTLAQKYHAMVVVDDAHATGVLGLNGRGTPEHFRLNGEENIFQSETMSKALGAYGGFISAAKTIIHRIRTKSSVYIGSTALPPPLAAAGCAAIQVLQQHPEIRARLFENAKHTREQIRKMDFATTLENTPIIPIFLNSSNSARGLSEFLKKNNIIVPYIKYPVKMDKFIVRITVSANHTTEQIEKLLELLMDWRKKNGIN